MLYNFSRSLVGGIMIRIEDVDAMIELAQSFLEEPIKQLGSSEFDRGGYAMLYKLIDSLERMKESNIDDN